MTKLFLVALLLASAGSVHAQDSKSAPYPTMAPIEQYRIANREDEIALAPRGIQTGLSL